jgi:hypothetical protein
MTQAIKQGFVDEWAAARAQGRTAELATSWATQGLLEVASFFVGVGEVKAALRGTRVGAELARLSTALGSVLNAVRRVGGWNRVARALRLANFEHVDEIVATLKKLEEAPDEALLLKFTPEELDEILRAIDAHQATYARFLGVTRKWTPPPAVRRHLDDLLGQREVARVRRDYLEAQKKIRDLTTEETAELTRLRGEVNRASWRLGEDAADAYMQSEFPGGTKLYPPPGAPARSGDFDQVWKVIDENGDEALVVVEAKGGRSGLGWRNVDGVPYQQGNPRYLDSIIDAMMETPEGRAAARQLRRAGTGEVRYLEIRQPIGTRDGHSVLREVEVKEFDLAVPQGSA